MLLSLLILGLIFLLCSAYGVAVTGFVSHRFNLTVSTNIFLTVTSGMMFMSIPMRLLHFIFPAGNGMALFLFLTGLLLARVYNKDYQTFLKGVYRQWQEMSAGLKLMMVVALISVLYNFLSRNNGFDTGAYHLQAIQWFENYKTVPGLGNLIEQISFNSQWFLLQAPLSFSFTGVRSIYVLNILVFLIFIFDLLHHLFVKKSPWNMFRLVVLIYIPFMLFGKAVSSPTPDIPVTLLTIYLLLHVLENHGQIKQHTDALLLLLLPFFLVSIKLSALPMLLLSALMLFAGFVRWRKIFLPALLVGLFILIPWAGSTFIQSGYWVFPLKATAFPKTEWTVPDVVANRVHVEIKGWARAPFIDFKTNGTNSPIALLESWKTKLTGMRSGDYVDIEKVADMSLNEWLPIWFQRLNVVNLGLILFTLLTGFILLGMVFIHRKRVAHIYTKQREFFLVYGIIVFGLLFWFINAPDLRFSHGVILPFIGVNLSAVLYLSGRFLFIQKVLKPVTLLLFLVLIAGNYTFFKSFYPKNLVAATWFRPLPYITPVLETKQIPGGEVKVATYPQKCWDSPLPCTCIFYEGLKFRGEHPGEGFIIARK